MATDAENEAPTVTVNDAVLDAKGFTNSGSKNFKSTVEDYTQQLMDRAVHFGEAEKAEGM